MLDKRIVFFKKKGRSDEFTVDAETNRKIITAILRRGDALTYRQISSEANVSFSTAYEKVNLFVKAGLVKPLQIAKHNHRQDHKYDLIRDGIIAGVVVDYESPIPSGVDHVPLLQKAFQSKPGTDSVRIFFNWYMLNALDRGLLDYIVRFLKASILFWEKQSFIEQTRSADKDWQTVRVLLGKSVPTQHEEKILRECIFSAYMNLNEDDKLVVTQYFKSQIENVRFHTSLLNEDRKEQILTARSQSDSNHFILSFKCTECDYINNQLPVPATEAIANALIGKGVICPSCNAEIKEQKVAKPARL